LIYSIGRPFIRVTPPIIDAVTAMPSSTFQEVGAFLLQCTGTPLNVVPALGTILEHGFEAARLRDLLTMGTPCDGPTTSRNAQSLTDSDQKWVDGKKKALSSGPHLWPASTFNSFLEAAGVNGVNLTPGNKELLNSLFQDKVDLHSINIGLNILSIANLSVLGVAVLIDPDLRALLPHSGSTDAPSNLGKVFSFTLEAESPALNDRSLECILPFGAFHAGTLSEEDTLALLPVYEALGWAFAHGHSILPDKLLRAYHLAIYIMNAVSTFYVALAQAAVARNFSLYQQLLNVEAQKHHYQTQKTVAVFGTLTAVNFYYDSLLPLSQFPFFVLEAFSGLFTFNVGPEIYQNLGALFSTRIFNEQQVLPQLQAIMSKVAALRRALPPPAMESARGVSIHPALQPLVILQWLLELLGNVTCASDRDKDKLQHLLKGNYSTPEDLVEAISTSVTAGYFQFPLDSMPSSAHALAASAAPAAKGSGGSNVSKGIKGGGPPPKGGGQVSKGNKGGGQPPKSGGRVQFQLPPSPTAGSSPVVTPAKPLKPGKKKQQTKSPSPLPPSNGANAPPAGTNWDLPPDAAQQQVNLSNYDAHVVHALAAFERIGELHSTYFEWVYFRGQKTHRWKIVNGAVLYFPQLNHPNLSKTDRMHIYKCMNAIKENKHDYVPGLPGAPLFDPTRQRPGVAHSVQSAPLQSPELPQGPPMPPPSYVQQQPSQQQQQQQPQQQQQLQYPQLPMPQPVPSGLPMPPFQQMMPPPQFMQQPLGRHPFSPHSNAMFSHHPHGLGGGNFGGGGGGAVGGPHGLGGGNFGGGGGGAVGGPHGMGGGTFGAVGGGIGAPPDGRGFTGWPHAGPPGGDAMRPIEGFTPDQRNPYDGGGATGWTN